MDYSGVDGIKQKGNRLYVQNAALLREIKKSKEQDQLTNNAIKMLWLMTENLSKTRKYKYSEDKEDCIQTAMMDIAMYWKGFDSDRFTNPFAYYTSMITNGLQKGWNKIYGKFKASEMTSLDNHIHSF